MADSMKATLQIDADTTGLARGVAGAVAQLKLINQAAVSTAMATNITAGLGLLRMAVDLVRSAIDMVDQRQQELMQKALTWSPEAIAAQAKADTMKMAADRAIGVTMGPGAASAQMSAAQAAMMEAQRVKKISPELNGAMAGWGSLKADAGSFWSTAMDQFSMLFSGEIGGMAKNLGTWLDQSGTMQFYTDSKDFMNPGSVEARGEGVEILRKILKALGG